MCSLEIKAGIVRFFKGYLDSILDNNNLVLTNFNKRDIKNKVVIAPSRLTDKVDEMLSLYRQQSGNGLTHNISKLPVFIIGFDNNYNSTGLEKGRSHGEKITTLDDNGDYFYIKLDRHDTRVQFVLIASDNATSFSLSSQFKLYCSDFKNRHITSVQLYNHKSYEFPIIFEDFNIFGANQQNDEAHNLIIKVFDVNFQCITAYFSGDTVTKEPYLPLTKSVSFHVSDESRFKNNIDFFKVLEDGNSHFTS